MQSLSLGNTTCSPAETNMENFGATTNNAYLQWLVVIIQVEVITSHDKHVILKNPEQTYLKISLFLCLNWGWLSKLVTSNFEEAYLIVINLKGS